MIARLRVRHDDEDGFVLPVVMGIALVMLVVIATSLAVAGSGYTKAARDADYSAALSAAYAGLADYQSRLSNDSRYVTYGNPASAFTRASSSSVTLPTQAVNPAFGNAETDDWALIPGSEQGAAYRYEVDNSKYASQGVLRLRVTGKVGQITRSIVADMRQNGFLSYVYFTDYETQDPAFGNYAECERYAYDGRASRCLEIEFGNDTLTGPVHSNDRIRACATTFGDKVTTSSPGGAWTQSSCGSNTWKAGLPSYVNRVDIPATNSEMKKETRSDLPGDVPRPGCLYTGPTSITYNGNGTMTVQSPWTKFTNTTEAGTGTNPARCGSPAQLASAAGATVDVLDGNLIYVQNVPAAGSNDPNANTGYPAGFTCNATQPVVNKDYPSEYAFEGWSYQSTRYPIADEVRPDFTSNAEGKKAYGCRSGDAFVKGQVKGATTLAAENFVYITGNLTYVDRARDVLGIVGNNSVWVWNPRKLSGAIYTSSNRTIDAAIMSVAHTFTVQNYNRSPQRGTLTVFGSIAQKFRGPVRQNGGYSKNYIYDTRLKSIAPPKFITPVSTTYDTLRAGGVAAAFNPNGKAL